MSRSLHTQLGLLVVMTILCGSLQVWASTSGPRTKLFVIAESAGHKAALTAAVSADSVRMEFASSRNRAIFSGEFTPAQIRALAAQGARFEPVEEIFPARAPQRFGHLLEVRGYEGRSVHPASKPVSTS